MSIQRFGGLVHWRIGNIGGSFYRSNRRAREAREAARVLARRINSIVQRHHR